MKASELKAGTLYAKGKYATAGVLLSNEAIYGTARSVIGGGLRVSSGKNYAVLTVATWGKRLTTEQLKAAAEGFKPSKPGEIINEDDIPAGTEIEFWPSRSFDGEYEAVVAQHAALAAKRDAAFREREEILNKAREDREETQRRLNAILPDAGNLFEGGSPASVTISIAALKDLLRIAEGTK